MDNLSRFSLILFLPTLWILLRLSAPGESPLAILSYSLRSLRERKALLYFASLLSVLAIDVVLTAYDSAFTKWIGHDFSKEIFAIEGRFVASVQELFAANALRLTFVWIYVLIYPLLLLSVLLLLHYREDSFALAHFWWAFVLNYALALPFYLFFPVTEVGWIADSGAVAVLEETFSDFSQFGRQFSGIDNCFPSLHTSLAVTAAGIAFQARSRAFRIVTATAAGAILLSTLVLGIHWGLDLIAGLAHAALCLWLGKRLARSPLPYS